MTNDDRMNARDERDLYHRDPVAWRQYVAPRLARLMRDTHDADAISLQWSLMTRELQRSVWSALDSATRCRVLDARRRATVVHFPGVTKMVGATENAS